MEIRRPTPRRTRPFGPAGVRRSEQGKDFGRLHRLLLESPTGAFFAEWAGLVFREIVRGELLRHSRGPMSAFTIAFQVPNLGPSRCSPDAEIQAAFVPVSVSRRSLEKGNKTRGVPASHSTLNLILVTGWSLGRVNPIFVARRDPWSHQSSPPGFSGGRSSTSTVHALADPLPI